jgi:membrane-associated phospholipid phosphatase
MAWVLTVAVIAPGARARAAALALLASAATRALGADAVVAPAPGAADVAGDDVGWNLHAIADLPADAARIVSAPLRWSRWDWLAVGALAAGGIALHQEDGRISAWFARRASARNDRWANDVKPFGAAYAALSLGAVAGLSLAVDDRRLTRTAVLGGEAELFAFGLYEMLQIAVERQRPGQGADADDARPLRYAAHGHSFPSGHATAAFALATVVADEWKAEPVVGVAAYTLATLVGLSRLESRAHWPTDVAGGALVGWAMATGVESCHLTRGVALAPAIAAWGPAIALQARF